MKLTIRLTGILFLFFYLTSCEKNVDANQPENCTSSTEMKIKRWQSLFDTAFYVEAAWNTDGSIQQLKMNEPFTEYRTATYIYENGKIKQAVLRDNYTQEIYDTAVYHYSSDGLVDSMYLKNDDYFNYKLTYSAGKLIKYTRFTGSDVFFYWTIQTDGFNNIHKADEYMPEANGFVKTSAYTYSRDNRKNPFEGLAPYMFYLDNDYAVFRYWGPNNYTNQNYVDHSGSGINLNTGYKFKYNSNCYPATSQQTLHGGVVFADDDFEFIYY